MNFLWHLLAVIAMHLPMILGYNVVFGKGKFFHFGPIAVLIIAAYASVLTQQAMGSFFVGFIASVFSAFALSMLFAWLALRLPPDGLGVMSIAVHLAVLALVLNGGDFTRGALGIPRIPRLWFMDSLPGFALTTLIVAVGSIVFLVLLHRTAFGRSLDALAEHPTYAQAVGVHRRNMTIAAFAIAALGAAITGFFMPQYLRLLHPNDYGFPALIFTIMIIVAGKPGSVIGCSLATILLILLKEGLRFIYIPQWTSAGWAFAPLPSSILGPMLLMLFGVVLFVAVWWRRDCLFPQQRRV